MSENKDYCNKEDLIEAIKNNSISFNSISDKWKDNEDFMLSVVEKDYNNYIKYASDRLKNDKNFVFLAMKKDPYILRFVSDNLRSDKELILKIIDEIEWPGLVYISKSLKDDKELIIKAMEKHKGWLAIGSERLQNDLKMLEYLEDADFSNDHFAYQDWYDERMDVLELLREKEFMEKSIKVSNKLADKHKF